MFFVRVMMFPFALLYDGVTRVRNHLYNKGLKPGASFAIPVLGVGNLTVGGTGKTPMIEYLLRRLAGRRVATLSRGYGRKTRGIRLTSTEDSADTVGDEPYQLYTKFGRQATIAVGEDRALAIPHILQEHPDTEVILLDDAYQHRRVKPSLQILLTDYGRPFYKDFVMPAGRLREARAGANRADVVVVTKCPQGLSEATMDDITRHIRRYTAALVCFASIRYGEPQPATPAATTRPEKVVLVTALANSAPLEAYVAKQFTLCQHLQFADHHRYTERDVLRMKVALPETGAILTTEKDYVKLMNPILAAHVPSCPIFYLPIEVFFIRNGEEFDAIVQEAVVRNV